jgi:hypothetical protein
LNNLASEDVAKDSSICILHRINRHEITVECERSADVEEITRRTGSRLVLLGCAPIKRMFQTAGMKRQAN